jgi:DNA-binding transcriptional ArsR family regulator
MVETHPDNTFIIRDLDTLKVVADPLHIQIFDVLIRNTLTVKQIAEKLGLSSSKLYYHINLMEKHGLIRVVDTRVVSGIIEKHYRAVATQVDVDPALLAFATDTGKQNVSSVVVSTIDATREDLLRSLEARSIALEQGAEERSRRVILTRLLSRLPDDRADEFGKRLDALMQEFDAADVADQPDELQTYALAIAFYPSFYFRSPGDASSTAQDTTD